MQKELSNKERAAILLNDVRLYGKSYYELEDLLIRFLENKTTPEDSTLLNSLAIRINVSDICEFASEYLSIPEEYFDPEDKFDIVEEIINGKEDYNNYNYVIDTVENYYNKKEEEKL